ncbi:MAG: glycosyltransferase [bacterium]
MNNKEKDNNIKCLFLIPRMGNGGAERVLATLANELSRRGYDIVILTLTSDESFYKLDPAVKIIGAKFDVNQNNKVIRNFHMGINGMRAIFFINRYIRSWKPEIVLSFLTHTNILSLKVHLFNRRIPLVISERCEPNARNFLSRIITKYFYPMANTLVCQSKKVANFFPKYAQKKIKVIYNPINRESIPHALPLVRRKVIVGVGRLFSQKNFSLLIESFNDIKDEFPEYILEIYGEGHLRDDLQTKIKNLGLHDRVFLMGIKKDVMKSVYDAQLFVLSSDFEGFPNALVEAMASGLPVISTDFSTGIAREFVKKENGIVVPVGDKSSMSNAIRRILYDNDMQKRMSQKNRTIMNKLSTRKIVDIWSRVFEEVLK